MKVGIPIIALLLATQAHAESATILTTEASAPSSADVLAAYTKLGVTPALTALGGKAGTVYQVGAQRCTVSFIAGPDSAADKAAEQSLIGFLQDWRPAAHSARVVVGCEQQGRAGATSFLRVVAAVALAAKTDAVYLPTFAVTQPAAPFIDSVRNEPPLVVGWAGIERRMDGKRAVFVSHGMALVDLPELTLTVPIEKSADALTRFLERLEQAQARPADAKPLPSPWTIDLD